MKKIKIKRLNIYLITAFVLTSVLAFSRIYAEYSAINNAHNAISTSARDLTAIWKRASSGIFMPSLWSDMPIGIEASKQISDRDFRLKAIYSPQSKRLTASLSYEGRDTKNQTCHIYADSESAGVSVDGADGTYYSISSDKLKTVPAVSDAIKKSKTVSALMNEKNLKYAKGVIQTAGRINSIKLDKDKAISQIAELFFNCRFNRSSNVYITTSSGRVEAKEYSFRVKTKYIAGCISAIGKDIVESAGSDILTDVYNRVYTSLSDVGEEYTHISLIVHDGHVFSSRCTLPSASKHTFAADITPDYASGYLNVKITDEAMQSEVINVKLIPADRGITVCTLFGDMDIRCSFDSQKLSSIVKKDEKKVFDCTIKKRGEAYDVSLRFSDSSDISPAVSFKVYNCSNADFNDVNKKDISEIGIKDTLSIAKLLNLAKDLQAL